MLPKFIYCEKNVLEQLFETYFFGTLFWNNFFLWKNDDQNEQNEQNEQNNQNNQNDQNDDNSAICNLDFEVASAIIF